MRTFQDFQTEHSHVLSKLGAADREAYLKICLSASHLRSRTAWGFYRAVLSYLEVLGSHAGTSAVIRGAVLVSARNWALVLPFFRAVSSLSQVDAVIGSWAQLARQMAGRDVDVGIAFLNHTPAALKTYGEDHLVNWGKPALAALGDGAHIWKAVKAYLEESVADRSATPLQRWAFFLKQAARIGSVSAVAAESFIRHGNRTCRLLDDHKTEQWITTGLTDCRTEDERIGFFSGTSLKAMATRDRLVGGSALKDKRHTLSLICEAFLGRAVKIRSNASLTGFRAFSGGAATDGHVIYLPDIAQDFGLYKLMALHQAMLMDRLGAHPIRGLFDPSKMHTEADEELLERLPGLFAEMRRQAETPLPTGYPAVTQRQQQAPLPWWGDILPDLLSQTRSAVDELKAKAADEAALPPELVETLLAHLMAEGHRDTDILWQMLMKQLDQSEFLSPQAEEVDAHTITFLYNEWDENLADYKLDWCLLRQRIAREEPNGFVEDVRARRSGIIRLIRRQFVRLRPERFKKFKAQPAGDHLDIDALVLTLVDRRSSGYLSENVYIRRDKRIRDVAVLFLIDTSASTEEEIDGRRVIDIQKEAMTLMAEALESLGDAYAVFGFRSEGRFRVDFHSVKEFGEPYSERVAFRLGNLDPGGLTRMGTAIRHAAHKFEEVRAAVKLMVILTDGRPYDLEYGTLDYAIADTRRAIQEARRQRIHPFIITSDKKGLEYVHQISPQTQSIVLAKVELLPTLLPAIYKRLTV